MGRRGPRQVVFVCSAIINGKLFSEMIEQETSEEAQKRFVAKYEAKPESILGPFYRKRTGVLLNSQAQVRFTGKHVAAIFNEWYVKAMLLSQPEDCVWVFFDLRVDGKKQPKPQSFIMKAEELRYLTSDEEKEYRRVIAANAALGNK